MINLKKHHLAATCWLGLMLLTILWDGIFSPLQTSYVLMLIKLISLALPLRGILLGRIYTYQYCSMLILLPFMEGVMRLWDAVAWSAWFAGVQVLLSVLFFVLCLIYLKQFKKPKTKNPKIN